MLCAARDAHKQDATGITGATCGIVLGGSAEQFKHSKFEIPMEMNYRVRALYGIVNEMVDLILAHETKTRGKEFTVQDLIAELEAEAQSKHATPTKPARTARRQPVQRAEK